MGRSGPRITTALGRLCSFEAPSDADRILWGLHNGGLVEVDAARVESLRTWVAHVLGKQYAARVVPRNDSERPI